MDESVKAFPMIFKRKKKETKISRDEFGKYAESMISRYLLGRIGFEIDSEKLKKSDVFFTSDLSDGLEFLSLGLRRTHYNIEINKQNERDFFRKIENFLPPDGKGSRWIWWFIPFVDDADNQNYPDLSLQFILDEFWKIIPDESKL